MYSYTNAHIHMYMHAYNTCKHADRHIHSANTHACMHIHTYIHTHMHAYIHTCIHIYILKVFVYSIIHTHTQNEDDIKIMI